MEGTDVPVSDPGDSGNVSWEAGLIYSMREQSQQEGVWMAPRSHSLRLGPLVNCTHHLPQGRGGNNHREPLPRRELTLPSTLAAVLMDIAGKEPLLWSEKWILETAASVDRAKQDSGRQIPLLFPKAA